jgi:hypothetical protein
MGAFSLGADPFPLGPRHCGQFDDFEAASELRVIDRAINRMYFIGGKVWVSIMVTQQFGDKLHHSFRLS